MLDYQATGVAGTPKLPQVSCYFDFGGEGGDRARFFFSGGPKKSIDSFSFLQFIFCKTDILASFFTYNYRLELPPAPSNIHHQEHSIFSRESQGKPSLVAVTGWGVDRNYPVFFSKTPTVQPLKCLEASTDSPLRWSSTTYRWICDLNWSSRQGWDVRPQKNTHRWKPLTVLGRLELSFLFLRLGGMVVFSMFLKLVFDPLPSLCFSSTLIHPSSCWLSRSTRSTGICYNENARCFQCCYNENARCFQFPLFLNIIFRHFSDCFT